MDQCPCSKNLRWRYCKQGSHNSDPASCVSASDWPGRTDSLTFAAPSKVLAVDSTGAGIDFFHAFVSLVWVDSAVR